MNEKMDTIVRMATELDQVQTLKLAMAEFIQAIITHFKEITSRCHARLITPNVVNTNTLKNDLQSLHIKLQTHSLQLAIPANNIADYYKPRICRCHILDNEIQISIKIPINPLDHHYDIYEPIAIPF